MQRGIFGLLFAGSLLTASPAWAIFNVQVLGGQRSSELDGDGATDTIKGSELRFAAHLDPIPLVPVGFGLSFAQTDFDKKDSAKLTGTDIDLEVEAWLPIGIAGLLPFAKLAYTLAGEYETAVDVAGADSIKLKYKPSGVNLSVGVKYEILLRLGVMAQVEFGNRQLKFDKAENTGGATVTGSDVDQKSTSILLGAQAGI